MTEEGNTDLRQISQFYLDGNISYETREMIGYESRDLQIH